MAQEARQIRVLALATEAMQATLHQQIASFDMTGVVVTSAVDLAPHIWTGELFQVVLLPATLSRTEDWWTIWGGVATLRPKPAILVYAQKATFQLWSGVLESGGYDVIVEPLTDEKLMESIMRAVDRPEEQ